MTQHDEYTDGRQDDIQPDPEDTPDIETELETKRRQLLCAVCRTRKKDTSENSRSQLCYECRQELLTLRIPTKIKVFLAVVCAVFILSVAMLPPVLSLYQVYIEADRQMEAREFAFAYDNYSLVLDRYQDSMPVILKTAEAAMAAQYFDTVTYIVNSYVADRELNDSNYETVMEYVNFLNAYYATADELTRISEEVGSAFAEEDSIALRDALRREWEALLSQDGMDRSLIYFYLGNIAPTVEDGVNYLRLATGQDPRVTYPYAQYGTMLRRAGNLDAAAQTYQRALALNACDASAMRGLGIVRLLEGDHDAALALTRQAYDIEPYGLYIADALIIALCENNLREEALVLLAQLEAEGMELDDTLQGYLNGEISLQQYYTS